MKMQFFFRYFISQVRIVNLYLKGSNLKKQFKLKARLLMSDIDFPSIVYFLLP